MKMQAVILVTMCLCVFNNTNDIEAKENNPTKAYLRKATGNLKIDKSSTTETYEAYFHIPIPFQEQVPILVEVESPQLIDYRFVHLNPPNVIIAARMNQASTTRLNWTCWVLIKENSYSDIPRDVPIPVREQLPDSVKKWLQPTDCVQADAKLVQEAANYIRSISSDLTALAEHINEYCQVEILWEFTHSPVAFDAVYALTWGSSCTGHAHAGAALFRANGVPARILLNMPTWATYFDHHWIIDYFVPDYGWVRMETTTGQHPCFARDEIVTLACNPEDEFSMFYPCGIEGYWHTSDPELGMSNPDWGRAHSAYNICTVSDSTSKIEQAHSLTDSLFFYYSHYWGIQLTSVQQTISENAFTFQKAALANLKAKDLNGYIINMQEALNLYKNIKAAPLTTIFFDDFERAAVGWTHGGNHDEWEVGTPTYGPLTTHSGANCWGVDLDGTYENNANCWLKSPPIDLANSTCAYLSFWVWNWVQDRNMGYVNDPLWLDITVDGTNFSPLCSNMGGVNDDPDIPDVGGWNMMVLDLTKYVGNMIQFRFRFRADANNVQPGPYIDDVHVYGRALSNTAVNQAELSIQSRAFHLFQNHPNPFNPYTIIEYELQKSSQVELKVYDVLGHELQTLVNRRQEPGRYQVQFKDQNLATGIYFYRLRAGEFVATKKMLITK